MLQISKFVKSSAIGRQTIDRSHPGATFNGHTSHRAVGSFGPIRKASL